MDSFEADIKAVSAIDSIPLMLDVVCRVTGMGFAAVARVTEDRWIACSVEDRIGFGLKPGGELPVLTTICNEIRNTGEGVIFDNADAHPVFKDHHTPQTYGLKSYISLPIRLRDGTFFGTLCAIDPKPHTVDTPEIIGMFRLFAELIAQHLSADARLAASHAQLLEAQHAAELREQFMAVLGHDLRNPLSAIASGVGLLQRSVPEADSRGQRVLKMMQQSTLRMSELIENLLDFARGRLGAGITLNRDLHFTLEPAITQVVNELRSAWPDRTVETRFEFAAPVSADAARIGQMVSNLVGNALSHGDRDAPVRITAISDRTGFWLSVANEGAPIPREVMERLFLPFSRGEVLRNQQGLGLGLYIAAEIAKAHGGTLTAQSTEEETKFIFRMGS
jgi:signal transduction histidine kinase